MAHHYNDDFEDSTEDRIIESKTEQIQSLEIKIVELQSENENLKQLSKNILEILNKQSELVNTPTGKEYIRRMIYDINPELNPY